MKIHERMSEKRCFYMIVFLAVILFVLSGCEKQQPESESADSIPTINIGISARTGLSKNLSEVNQTLGDLTEEKIGVRARLVWTGLNSSQGNSYYKNRQLGVDILNIYFNQFENYRQKNLLLDMEPYMAEALALQEVLDEKTDLPEDEREGVYGIPKPLSDIHTNGVILNRTYVEKYHMDISNIHKPEDLDTSKAAGEETVSTQEKPEGTVKDSQADTTAESTPAEEKDNEVTVAPQPVKTEEKLIAPKTTEMSEEDRTAEILSADTIDLRDTLDAVKEQEPEVQPQEPKEETQPEVSAEEAAETAKEEAKEEKETVKIPEEPVKTVTEAAVTTPVEATPVKPIDVTFTSMDDEPKEKEEPKAMVQIEAEDKVAKNEDLVPTLDSLLQDLNMNNKEKKTDDPFEFLGSVDF